LIESEEKRIRLNEIIMQWCEHIKVLPQLREYDIPRLVSLILEEFYTIDLTCGHLVRSFHEGKMLTFNEHGGETTGLYCSDCFAARLKEKGKNEINQS